MREEFQYSNFSKYSHKHPEETINKVMQQACEVREDLINFFSVSLITSNSLKL